MAFQLQLYVLLSALSTALALEQFLWTHWYNPAGFGDSVRDWYEQLALAQAVGRTLVLPPFVIERSDLSGVKNVNPSKILAKHVNKTGAELNQYMHELSTRKHCYNILPPELVEVSEWFELSILKEFTPVIPLSTWNSTSSATIDVLLTHVTGEHQNCLTSPEYEYPCRTILDSVANVKHPDASLLKLTDDEHVIHAARRGEDLRAQQVYCVGNAVVSQFGLDAQRNSPERLAEFLQQWPDATTLGIDIYCPYNFFKLNNAGQVHRDLRKYLRFNSQVLSSMRSFLTDALGGAAVPHGDTSGNYVAFHWRRGDVSLNHASTFLKHTPDAVVAAIERQLSSVEDISSLDGFVLLTDCPYEKELKRIKRLVETRLKMKFARYTAETQADSLVMDLALGSYAKVLYCNYAGSFYANFMAQERELLGLPADTFSILRNIEWSPQPSKSQTAPKQHEEL